MHLNITLKKYPPFCTSTALIWVKSSRITKTCRLMNTSFSNGWKKQSCCSKKRICASMKLRMRLVTLKSIGFIKNSKRIQEPVRTNIESKSLKFIAVIASTNIQASFPWMRKLACCMSINLIEPLPVTFTDSALLFCCSTCRQMDNLVIGTFRLLLRIKQ